MLAGQRAGALLAARLTLITLAALLATGVSLAVTATVASIGQWGSYIAASVFLALTHALIGVILAPVFGRVAGVLIAFLVPFLDLGIAQDPMLHATPPAGARFLPGYGGFRVLTYAILTRGFSQAGPLLIALAWLAGLTPAAAMVFRYTMATAGHAGHAAGTGRRPQAGDRQFRDCAARADPDRGPVLAGITVMPPAPGRAVGRIAVRVADHHPGPAATGRGDRGSARQRARAACGRRCLYQRPLARQPYLVALARLDGCSG